MRHTPHSLLSGVLIEDPKKGCADTSISKMPIIERSSKTLSLSNYERRKEELVATLLSIAERDGFSALTDHGITEAEITTIFAMSERFFALPGEVKENYPFERSKISNLH